MSVNLLENLGDDAGSDGLTPAAGAVELRPHRPDARADGADAGQQSPPSPSSSRALRPLSLLLLTPGARAFNRWAFRTVLDTRRRARRALRPLRWRTWQAHRDVSELSWRWYRLRFRVARLRLLRQLQFTLRHNVGVHSKRRLLLEPHQLLLGGWNGMSGYRFAERSGMLLDGSTPLGKSFYEELLAAFDRNGENALSDARLRTSGYFKRISIAAALSGHYRGQRTPEGLIQVTREYVDRYRGRPVPYRPGRSKPGTLPQVRAIANSDRYQVLDGHHRLAMQIHNGAEQLEVLVAPGKATTYAQQLLLEMSWLDGSPRLYQPVDFPEVRTWPLMRKCGDRLAMMAEHLANIELLPYRTPGIPGVAATYLDVGSCYGWFVAEMGKLGFDAHGIELDPLALELGPLAYGLDPTRITIGDCVDTLRTRLHHADVVSCFSLLHHFVIGRGTAAPEELIQELDAATGRVLFLDTGQAHESWFRLTLPEWTPAYTADWIRANSSFTTVEAIGVDQDGGGRFRGKFGRTLFACSR